MPILGCESIDLPFDFPLPNDRIIATTYEVQSPQANCHRKPQQTSRSLITLKRGYLVDLVSLEEKLIQEGDIFWLHVYPRLSHRYSCYMDVKHLIPRADAS